MTKTATIAYTAACPGCGADAEWWAITLINTSTTVPVHHEVRCDCGL